VSLAKGDIGELRAVGERLAAGQRVSSSSASKRL